MRAPKGFTLLEISLTITLVLLFMAVAIPFSLGYQSRNDFAIAVQSTAQSLRRAQALAQAGDGDASWGVHVESGSITLFQGDSFLARETTLDEVFLMPEQIELSGLSDVVFLKFSGLPASPGTMTFALGQNEVADVVVNAKGMIEY